MNANGVIGKSEAAMSLVVEGRAQIQGRGKLLLNTEESIVLGHLALLKNAINKCVEVV